MTLLLLLRQEEAAGRSCRKRHRGVEVGTTDDDGESEERGERNGDGVGVTVTVTACGSCAGMVTVWITMSVASGSGDEGVDVGVVLSSTLTTL